MRILRADNGVGPTGKQVREDERFQRKLDKEQRLLEKFAGKQARRTGMSETEALLEALNNPEQFEAFKERRQILKGLAGMAGLGVLGAAVPAVSRMRRRIPGGYTPQGAQTHQTNFLERLFPGLFGIDG